ncbi:hypothetical protein H6F67_19440 [Microcoleus sp. FACHB-1515]|uniref:hypothetical protein n=1 Tax=Cyanophyceae TaxID=3028117 RepID=UPI001685B1B6|nr:hypothetical protein [Microcoleus sp. FACHB-1515]MBD2092025.1 hypothetical protein [Microcoleus sp. FACHB-1515]
MTAIPDEPQAWKFYSSDSFVSITYEDELIGFCKPDFASRIVEAMNDDERLRRALRIACTDLASMAGGSSMPPDDLVAFYLAKTTQPKTGTAAIAALLRQRQDELDVSNKEFMRFCESYRLSKVELQAIYAGEEIDSAMLMPLSRILGRSIEDLLQVLDGTMEA